MKDSYFIPAKQRLRRRLRKLIKSNFRSPSQLKVFCFPGPDLLEVTEVYDKLGIPRSNIYCAERDYESYQKIKIHLENVYLMDAVKFFRMWKKPFDVISLDYCGLFTDGPTETIARIAAKRLLGQRGLLFVEFLGQRESRSLMKSFNGDSIVDSISWFNGAIIGNETMQGPIGDGVRNQLFKQAGALAKEITEDQDWRMKILPAEVCKWLSNNHGFELFDLSAHRITPQDIDPVDWIADDDLGYKPLWIQPFKYISDKGSRMIAFAFLIDQERGPKHRYDYFGVLQETNILRPILDFGGNKA